MQLSRGGCDFTPRDLQIVAYDSKLRVVARQEVTSSATVTSRREFSRELDVTWPVCRSTWRAVLQCGEGLLWIAALIQSQTSSSSSSSSSSSLSGMSGMMRDTEAAAASSAVSSVLPADGLPCSVELR